MSNLKVFRVRGGQATEVPGAAVGVEVELQRLIEANMEAMLGIRFLATEYRTGHHGGRIDSLGLDENGTPVVVEYKRNRDQNVISQVLSYLWWLHDHHHEFESLVREQLGVEFIELRRIAQEEEKRKWGDAWKDTGRIFTEEDGSLLHPGRISDLFDRLVAEADLPPIRLHDLRHGAATLMLAAGVDIKVVSETLEHSDSRITRDIYQSVLDDLAHAAAAAVVKLVPRAPRAVRSAIEQHAARPTAPIKATSGCTCSCTCGAADRQTLTA
ncbi:tyrosine-type recombinase/integrase [Streptomyces sp. NPDC056257]|uniref:tyrosine-type recombinase/integrase n=1 Tax=Streptomyces sp. NPDC056257 TaxID=3345765 RepID=UPI0035DA97FC